VQIYGEATGNWTGTYANAAKLAFVCETNENTQNTSPCFEASDLAVTSQRDFTVNGVTNLNGNVFQNGTQVDLVNPVDWNQTRTFGADVTMNTDMWTKGTVLIGDGGTTTENTSVEAHMFRYLEPHPIAPLLPGSQSGLAIVGPENQHVVVEIRANGDEDSFAIVSNLTGATNDPKTPDGTLFRVQRTGDTFIGVNEELTYTQATKRLDLASDTTLNIGGGWEIGGVAVTATAGQLNAASSGQFDETADHVLSGQNTFTGATLLTGNVQLGGVQLTVDGADLNRLDGLTATATELNLLDGKTAVVAPNTLNNFTSNQTFSGSITLLGGIYIGGTQMTASGVELNKLDGLTASTAELNVLDGSTASTADLNKLAAITLTAT
jgi:hypothetical protein